MRTHKDGQRAKLFLDQMAWKESTQDSTSKIILGFVLQIKSIYYAAHRKTKHVNVGAELYGDTLL